MKQNNDLSEVAPLIIMILDRQMLNPNGLVSAVTRPVIKHYKYHLANLAAQRQPTDEHLPTTKAM